MLMSHTRTVKFAAEHIRLSECLVLPHDCSASAKDVCYGFVCATIGLP